jgi:hypothetical protein
MERKGKCPCHNPVYSVLIIGHGHTRRRKRRSRPITTPHTTPGRPRAHIRTMVLLYRTTEVPPRGRVGRAGIDLHLGQKPKLGGRYVDDSLIYISYFVGPLYIHVSLSFYFVASCFYFYFPKHKKTKNISVVSLYLFL